MEQILDSMDDLDIKSHLTDEGKRALSAAVMSKAQSFVEEVCHCDGIDATDLEKMENEFKKACKKIIEGKKGIEKGKVIEEF